MRKLFQGFYKYLILLIAMSSFSCDKNATPTSPAVINNDIYVWGIGGQSNIMAKGDTSLSPKTTSSVAIQYVNNSFRVANDPIGPANDTLYMGSEWPAMAIAYNQLTGRKICFVQSGVGNTSQVGVENTGKGTWDVSVPNNLTTIMIIRTDSALTKLKTMGYTVHFMGFLWGQGENDATGIMTNKITGQDYYNAFVNMLSTIRTHYGVATPFNVIELGTASSGNTFGFDTIRNRQEQLGTAGYVHIADRHAAAFVAEGLMNPNPFYAQLHYSQAGYNLIGASVGQNIAGN